MRSIAHVLMLLTFGERAVGTWQWPDGGAGEQETEKQTQ
jgi:hypothetical protein